MTSIDSDIEPKVGGPGGGGGSSLSGTRRGSESNSLFNFDTASNSTLRAPAQSEKPQRKGSRSAREASTPAYPGDENTANQTNKPPPATTTTQAQPTNTAPTGAGAVPVSPLHALPQTFTRSWQPNQQSALATKLNQAQRAPPIGPYGPVMGLDTILPPHNHNMYPTHPPHGSNLGLYQAALAKNTDVATLVNLQDDIDPLLESIDPFLNRKVPVAASPALQGLAPQQFTHNDLASLDSDSLRELVSAVAGRPIPRPGAVNPAFALAPERVDITPPRSPPGGNSLNPSNVIADLEKREIAKAAREILEEKLEGMEVRRKALTQFYTDNPSLDVLGDQLLPSTDPVRAVNLQRAANFDPFVRNLNLGIPEAVDPTRVPARGPQVYTSNPRYRRHSGHPAGINDDDFFITRDILEDNDDVGDPIQYQGPVTKVTPEPIHGASKSLLIGVGYRNTAYEIPDHVKNTHKMKAHLAENGFFGQQLVLTDEDGPEDRQPTHANILTAFQWLVEDAVPGNSLFLYFAGRSQHRAEHPQNTDILPSDFDVAGAMPDTLITETLLRNLPDGVRLTVVADCCPDGQLIELPYKLVANKDGSFRAIEGVRNRCPGNVQQICGRRENDQSSLGAPLQNLTTCFVETCGVSANPSYRDLMVGLRKGMNFNENSSMPEISFNRPTDFRKSNFYLGAPESAADDDPRLCVAKQRTKDLTAELGNIENITEKRRQRADELRKEADRQRLLNNLKVALITAQEAEATRRNRITEEEDSTRHQILFQKLNGERLLFTSAISKSNWNRLPAGEHTGLPVVVGIKWQRPEEREQDTSITGPIGPGEQSRTFNVIPKNIEDNSFNPTQFLMQSADLLGRDASPVGVLSLPYSKSPPRESPLIPQSATHPYGGNGSAVKGAFIPGVDPVTPLTAALPVGDGVTARWKRIPDENEVARWVREESVSGSPAPIIPPHAMF
eukprot:TRINITY_DN5644_c0_g1_i1.p1 TRINITY_DN5644_c0_g1~~TRINITY_DN5644_c0_g1_i1.p1  ORF type:complete len:956 (+),score=154.13 TRINITY_DN5644_c0_g1_i1:168-3035(+)